jgi:acetyltransferase-like isoleucine patch superfamily enzyme
MIVKLLRALRDDITSPRSRFQYLSYLLSDLPGEVGMLIRSAIIPRFFRKAGKGVKVFPGTRFNGVSELVVGDGVMIGVDNFIQASAGLTIGDNTMTGPGVKIWTINHRTDSVDIPVQKQGYQYKPVRIGADVWLGSNVFIMPGVEIPDGCVVSAGSVVGIRKYPPYSIIAGYPARVIGYRKPHPDNPVLTHDEPQPPAGDTERPAACEGEEGVSPAPGNPPPA